jgi:hypothetical protein
MTADPSILPLDFVRPAASGAAAQGAVPIGLSRNRMYTIQFDVSLTALPLVANDTTWGNANGAEITPASLRSSMCLLLAGVAHQMQVPPADIVVSSANWTRKATDGSVVASSSQNLQVTSVDCAAHLAIMPGLYVVPADTCTTTSQRFPLPVCAAAQPVVEYPATNSPPQAGLTRPFIVSVSAATAFCGQYADPSGVAVPVDADALMGSFAKCASTDPSFYEVNGCAYAWISLFDSSLSVSARIVSSSAGTSACIVPAPMPAAAAAKKSASSNAAKGVGIFFAVLGGLLLLALIAFIVYRKCIQKKPGNSQSAHSGGLRIAQTANNNANDGDSPNAFSPRKEPKAANGFELTPMDDAQDVNNLGFDPDRVTFAAANPLAARAQKNRPQKPVGAVKPIVPMENVWGDVQLPGHLSGESEGIGTGASLQPPAANGIIVSPIASSGAKPLLQNEHLPHTEGSSAPGNIYVSPVAQMPAVTVPLPPFAGEGNVNESANAVSMPPPLPPAPVVPGGNPVPPLGSTDPAVGTDPSAVPSMVPAAHSAPSLPAAALPSAIHETPMAPAPIPSAMPLAAPMAPPPLPPAMPQVAPMAPPPIPPAMPQVAPMAPPPIPPAMPQVAPMAPPVALDVAVSIPFAVSDIAAPVAPAVPVVASAAVPDVVVSVSLPSGNAGTATPLVTPGGGGEDEESEEEEESDEEDSSDAEEAE